MGQRITAEATIYTPSAEMRKKQQTKCYKGSFNILLTLQDSLFVAVISEGVNGQLVVTTATMKQISIEFCMLSLLRGSLLLSVEGAEKNKGC
jgi:hypothetical protein